VNLPSVSSHNIVPDASPWYSSCMDIYLYLEIPLPLPIPEKEEEGEEGCEFLVRDYLEGVKMYVDC
jgi:hypothetical protein